MYFSDSTDLCDEAIIDIDNLGSFEGLYEFEEWSELLDYLLEVRSQ